MEYITTKCCDEVNDTFNFFLKRLCNMQFHIKTLLYRILQGIVGTNKGIVWTNEFDLFLAGSRT